MYIINSLPLPNEEKNKKQKTQLWTEWDAKDEHYWLIQKLSSNLDTSLVKVYRKKVMEQPDNAVLSFQFLASLVFLVS